MGDWRTCYVADRWIGCASQSVPGLLSPGTGPHHIVLVGSNRQVTGLKPHILKREFDLLQFRIFKAKIDDAVHFSIKAKIFSDF